MNKSLLILLGLLTVALSLNLKICSKPLVYRVKVTLQIYSGTENPSWTLNQHQHEELCAKLELTNYQLQDCQIAQLGYNGYLVSVGNERFTIFNNGELENYLMLTMPKHILLPITVYQHIAERQNSILIPIYCKNFETEFSATDCQNIVGPDTVPEYNPNEDVQGCFISDQYDNNCYDYGNDIATGTFAQPGRGSGQKWSENTCDDMRAASERDGLTWIGQTLPAGEPSVGHYVALFIWPDTNFHWIRKDKSTFWSHKPGGTEVRDYDNTGSQITDPTLSDFSPWTQFCGYMQTVPSKVKIN